MPAASPTPKANPRLEQVAKAVGCPELISLDSEPDAAHLDYLDLLPPRAKLRPDAVAEFQGRPILYLLDGFGDGGEAQVSAGQISELQQLLANRSEHACLAIARPGELHVYPINLDRRAIEHVDPQIIVVAAPDAACFFQSIATGAMRLPGQPASADYVFEEIHRLLQVASDALIGKLAPLDVLSLTGRALFFRFLHDRRIVLPSELNEISPRARDLRDVFSSAEKAAATAAWLDETFNGDLLPLVPGLDSETDGEVRRREYRRFFRKAHEDTDGLVFRHLEAILRGYEAAGATQFQLPLAVDWDDLNFAHIPVGVLSQVYETFSRQWDEAHADTTSVFYTPNIVARLVVEEALAGVKDAANAHVLDGACGAGVFLVLAFRRLYRARWEKDGRRPDTAAIHHILYEQLCGFDVSESALRLAALALYITAIELNGTNRPPRILKVPHALKDKVLFNFGPADLSERKRGFVLGSLGPDVPARFDGRFDVTLGNPPWTRLRPEKGTDETTKAADQARNDLINREFTAIARRVLTARDLPELVREYANPDNNPDLPFVWRATEWTKAGGVVAFALPARLILKQQGPGKVARDALLQAITVTSILNGSDLEKTPVWPNMDLPFLLLFARNSKPAKPLHHFHFVTPVRENPLCARGEFRIDYQSAQPVAVSDVIAKPWLLKTLGVGSSLDVEVLDKLSATGFSTLGAFWMKHSLRSGEGYNVSPSLRQHSAEDLHDLPDFELPENGFAIEFTQLLKWREKHRREKAHAPRDKALYQHPLVIVPQTPGEGRDRPKACLSERRRVAFSKSFYGYSAAGHPEAKTLASLLYLVVHSQLWQHFFLTHSSRIGASYRTILKEDLDAFPFPDVAKLTAAQKSRVLALAESLENELIKPWDELDAFIFRLYGLDEDDAIVVRDTVRFGSPYRSARQPAEEPPNEAEAKVFADDLEEMLQPFFEITGQRLVASILPRAGGDIFPPWRFLTLSLDGRPAAVSAALRARLMRAASRTAASRIVMRIPGDSLLLGLLNQRRFWTRSRARLCGLHISRAWLDAFSLPT
jgi:hypothetical protein